MGLVYSAEGSGDLVTERVRRGGFVKFAVHITPRTPGGGGGGGNCVRAHPPLSPLFAFCGYMCRGTSPIRNRPPQLGTIPHGGVPPLHQKSTFVTQLT
jgi:hypothetical protein